MKKQGNIPIRIILHLLGLFLVALSMRLALVANIGMNANASFALTLSKLFGKDMSIWMLAINGVCVLIQILILRREYKLYSLLQLVFAAVFSYFLAIVDPLVTWWVPGSYAVRLLQLAVSVLINGLGIFFVVTVKVMPMPAEGLIFAVQTKIKASVGKLRICFDVSCLLCALFFGLVFLGKVVGVREGTVIMAIFVGVFVDIYGKLFGSKVKALCFGRPNEQEV